MLHVQTFEDHSISIVQINFNYNKVCVLLLAWHHVLVSGSGLPPTCSKIIIDQRIRIIITSINIPLELINLSQIQISVFRCPSMLTSCAGLFPSVLLWNLPHAEIAVAPIESSVCKRGCSVYMHKLQLLKSDLLSLENIKQASKWILLHSCSKLWRSYIAYHSFVPCVGTHHVEENRLNVEMVFNRIS